MSHQHWDWSWLAAKYALSDTQIGQLRTYAEMLQEASERINVTALTALEDIIVYHFADSLELRGITDISKVSSCIDVGTGAGFPGLVLKIAYPHLRVVLLEVLGKRRLFLEQVIAALGLTNVQVCGDDWRTFLRSHAEHIDLVCARASLAPRELLRMFKPSSPLRESSLVYWASQHWEPEASERIYVKKTYSYVVGTRNRVLVQFQNQKSSQA